MGELYSHCIRHLLETDTQLNVKRITPPDLIELLISNHSVHATAYINLQDKGMVNGLFVKDNYVLRESSYSQL